MQAAVSLGREGMMKDGGGPFGAVVVWVTVWQSVVDAAQFVDALGQVAELRYRTPNPTLLYTGQRTYKGSKRTVVVTPMMIGGRHAVVYLDVPTGSSTSLMNAGEVTLK